MLSLTCFNRRFTPGWQMILLTSISLFILLRLGFWQLERAQEKELILKREALCAEKKPVFWQSKEALPPQSQKLLVQGRYLSDIFLLDNQPYRHQQGYHVLSPLQLPDKRLILIDRGWVPADNARQSLPFIEIPNEPVRLSGSVYYPSTKKISLGEMIEKQQGHYTVIEWIDTKIISQILHNTVYPFIIRLDKNEANGFVREWVFVSMPPQRHLAYAFQWFVMAVVVFILFIVLNFKKKV